MVVTIGVVDKSIMTCGSIVLNYFYRLKLVTKNESLCVIINYFVLYGLGTSGKRAFNDGSNWLLMTVREPLSYVDI